ncbi:SDR family oxidoreductase [Rathayibacter sp. YIM 133350]|uniref:SDR family NAD(P)-dependent oxidoreductase n=1 Tax=Rathayibacter sp. YIM 133350 TaxID=3131992 RepID=UPI00307E79B6
MDLGLQGKTVVVTGAGRGIGLATVRAFLAEGAHVVGGSLHETDDMRTLAAGGDFRFVSVDLSDADGPAALIDAVGGAIDVVVNNVGAAPARPQGFASIDDDMWQRSLTLNLLAAVRTCRAALPHMSAGGAIVNVTSVNSRLADPLVMDYSAAKAALLSFTKALSKEVGPGGIRVNSVSPGPVATDLWLGSGGVAETVSGATGASPEEVRKGAASAMATGRFTRPEEVADLIAILASARLGNVTGSDFLIDGGLIPTT